MNELYPSCTRSVGIPGGSSNRSKQGIPEIEQIARLLSKPLESSRLHIKPQMSTDADAAYPHLQNDALRQWISLYKPESVEPLREKWKRSESRISPDGREAWLSWFVTSKDDSSAIGCIDACIDKNRVAVNFGYYFFVHAWGQGFATEAASVVAKHLLANGVEKLIATVTTGNSSSVRVLEKLGFRYTRTIADNDTVNGVLVDDEEFVLANQDPVQD
jgi:RimJ/RimL family protein N-acetyltransferase